MTSLSLNGATGLLWAGLIWAGLFWVCLLTLSCSTLPECAQRTCYFGSSAEKRWQHHELLKLLTFLQALPVHPGIYTVRFATVTVAPHAWSACEQAVWWTHKAFRSTQLHTEKHLLLPVISVGSMCTDQGVSVRLQDERIPEACKQGWDDVRQVRGWRSSTHEKFCVDWSTVFNLVRYESAHQLFHCFVNFVTVTKILSIYCVVCASSY